jgi:cytochrome P450
MNRTSRESPVGSEASLFAPETYIDGCPWQRFAQLRAQCPVSWQPEAVDPTLPSPEVHPGWWAHTHEAAKAVLRNTDDFSSAAMGAVPMDPDEISLASMRLMFLNMDPPMHSRHRRLVSFMFTPARIRQLEPRVKEIAKDTIDRIAALGHCDAVEHISARMPMTVISELLGIPERGEELLRLSNRMIGAVDTPDEVRLADSMEASLLIALLAVELATEKRTRPDDTLMSAYVNGTLDAEDIDTAPPTDEDVGAFLLLMTIAGNETVRTATSQGIWALHEHPDQRDLLVSDLDTYLPGAVEEILRYRAPVRAMRRQALHKVELGGQAIEAGDKVIVHFSSALHDEAVFEEPERFDITRQQPSLQLAFGYGEHYCLGANLARLQLRSIFEEIYTRIPDIALDGPPVRQVTSLVEGLLSMPVRFTPEGATS